MAAPWYSVQAGAATAPCYRFPTALVLLVLWSILAGGAIFIVLLFPEIQSQAPWWVIVASLCSVGAAGMSTWQVQHEESLRAKHEEQRQRFEGDPS
jgi:hypothetical protein